MTHEGLGPYVRARRLQLKMTQLDLAAAIGASDRTYITQIERGRIKLPEPKFRQRLAAALGVREIDLLVAAGAVSGREVGEVIAVPLRLRPFVPELSRLNNANLELAIEFVQLLLGKQGPIEEVGPE